MINNEEIVDPVSEINKLLLDLCLILYKLREATLTLTLIYKIFFFFLK